MHFVLMNSKHGSISKLEKQYPRLNKRAVTSLRLAIPAGGCVKQIAAGPCVPVNRAKLSLSLTVDAQTSAHTHSQPLDERTPPPLRAPSAPLGANHGNPILISSAHSYSVVHTQHAEHSHVHTRYSRWTPVKWERERERTTPPTQRATDRLPDWGMGVRPLTFACNTHFCSASECCRKMGWRNSPGLCTLGYHF